MNQQNTQEGPITLSVDEWESAKKLCGKDDEGLMQKALNGFDDELRRCEERRVQSSKLFGLT